MRKLKTMDGNTAAAHVAYAFTEVAAIYPITPSSPMAELIDAWSATGLKNIFGQQVRVVEMQSEGGAAGALHGSVSAGALTSTFTASQGLLLMIPNLYKIAGELTPAVFHVAARALATHALSIFGDQSDVMACRGTGVAMLAATNPQEVMDLAAVAHLSTITGRIPVMHFFDGFRTSHEQQKIEVWDYDELKSMVDWEALAAFRARANNPGHPHLMGSAENPDTFFQHREAANTHYLQMPDVVARYMDEVNQKIGTGYKPFNYYGAPDAADVVVAMGSVCDAAEEVVDYLNAKGGKVGLVKVRLYRPFSQKHLLEALPGTVRRIAVLDRVKEPGAVGEPLYLDICAALRGTSFNDVLIVGGRYGLGSKDTTPGAVLSVYQNLASGAPKNGFTIGILDDVTRLSLPVTENPDTTAAGTISCKFWGLGSDGTVGANKNSIKIIGDYTRKKVQAYFQYDSKKSGGVTISHLRFGDAPIKSTYYITKADFVACHQASYMEKYDIVQDVKPGGVFLLNCAWTDAELGEHLPAAVRRYIARNGIRFYTCDAVEIARKLGLRNKTNAILQSAFFKLANVMPLDEAVTHMKEAVRKSYGKKGANVVAMNDAAIDAGIESLHEVTVPAGWADAADAPAADAASADESETARYVREILVPTVSMRSESLPVSKFLDIADGRVPSGTSAYEKRGIAVDVPQWIPQNCIQCNWCSMVCPHAAIRPFVMNDCEKQSSGARSVPLEGGDGSFAICISPLDCTGCGSCVSVCPAREKALKMVPLETAMPEQKVFDYAVKNVTEKPLPDSLQPVRRAQFRTPLLEFSGACAGCGEAPYAKLITQLFGDRMFIANATGCTSIWGCSAPSAPYTTNREGRGPAWANSLFEDNAEFGFGMATAMRYRRTALAGTVHRLISLGDCDADIRAAGREWLEKMNDGNGSRLAGEKLLAACREGTNAASADGEPCFCEACTLARQVIESADLLTKPSVWIFGGDGWAYDIGYGGLDHVLASGEDVNIFVFDTEVYSNTGGQASKATPMGAVAQFTAAGKPSKKKNLAQMAISYGHIYVAQVAMGANYDQTLKAILEAESYDGPSLIIGYAPCINHGIKAGMDKAMLEMRNAVHSSYWNLLRYDPRLAAGGRKALTVDSRYPSMDYNEFIMGEVRYNSLTLTFPERAEKLFAQAEEDAEARFEDLLEQRDGEDQGNQG